MPARRPYAIEHAFWFLKQYPDLNTNQSTQTVSTDHWMWLCALAFWQLLLMREFDAYFRILKLKQK